MPASVASPLLSTLPIQLLSPPVLKMPDYQSSPVCKVSSTGKCNWVWWLFGVVTGRPDDECLREACFWRGADWWLQVRVISSQMIVIGWLLWQVTVTVNPTYIYIYSICIFFSGDFVCLPTDKEMIRNSLVNPERTKLKKVWNFKNLLEHSKSLYCHFWSIKCILAE